MVTLVALLLTIMPQEPLSERAQAEAWLAEGRYLMAEGAFLDLDPAVEDVVPVAESLAGIALRTGDPAAKQSFYVGLLTRSPNWRRVALLVSSVLAAHQRDFAAFETYAGQFAREHRRTSETRYRLLYYLARYTDEAPAELVVGPAEAAWFAAARALSSDRVYPRVDDVALPYRIGRLYLLEASEPFFVPPLPEGAEDDDRMIAELLRIHDALLREDLSLAARTINAVIADPSSRPDHRTLFYRLMARFFEARGLPDRAETAKTNAGRLERLAVLPLVSLADHRVVIEDDPEPVAGPEPEPEVAVEPEPETEPVVDTPVATTTEPEPEKGPDPYLELEERLDRGERGLEFTIRALPSPTTYRKIFKNYLLGKHYLGAGNARYAEEHLTIALQLIKDLPFPHLEAAILTELARFHELGDREDKADWYRIDAAQIWLAPQNMPIFAERISEDAVSPQQILIDRALSRAAEEDVTGKVLFYSEQDLFIRQRRLAYQRETAASSPVIENQIRLVGNQLYSLVDSLANQTDSSATPERFNKTLQTWTSAWSQAMPYYQDQEVPTVERIQSSLTRRQHLFAFIEGARALGVLVIRADQAFTLSLGSREAFLAMSASAKIDFLSGRLGALWDQEGSIYLLLSPSLRDSGVIELLRDRVRDPSAFHLLFSLKAFATEKRIAPDTGLGLVITDAPVPSLPDNISWQLIPANRVDERTLARELDSACHLVLLGEMRVGPEGLAIGAPNQPFFFHRMLHYNPKPCSLTLVATELDAWGPLLDELALIDPAWRLSLVLLDEPDKLSEIDFSRTSPGVSLP